MGKKRIGIKGLKNLKAELTITTLVSLILLIIGFAIALFFYYNSISTATVDRDVCHQSVIMRGTLPSLGGAKDFVPLKCKSSKICITTGIIGGKCPEFQNSPGVTYIKVKTEDEIAKAISGEIIDCWNMMGEGKVSVFTDGVAQYYGIGNIGSSCVVCSRFAFDRANLQSAGIDLKKVYIMQYMMTHKVPNQNISYYEYLVGKQGLFSIKDNVQVNDIEINNKNELVQDDKKVQLNLANVPQGDVGPEMGIIFMQVSAPTRWGVIRNTVLSLGLGYGAAYGITGGFITKLPIPPQLMVVLGVIVGAVQQGSVTVNQEISAGYCGDVSLGDQAREGCSVVRAVDYNLNDMQRYCSAIESIA